jgi:benzoate/toluate 1,2-dioxygenase subunit alpha
LNLIDGKNVLKHSFDPGLLVDDRPDEGIFRVHRDVFAAPDLFELEMKYIFGRTWVFLAVESQVSKPHQFATAWIGKTPVLVMRDVEGKLGAFLNICPHKGTQLAHVENGSSKYHVCSYHGWAFNSSGKNVAIKDHKSACYPPAFDHLSHDLIPIAKVASYGGLIFGSLSPDVPSLEDYLGDMRTFVDLAMKQGPRGMEIIPGRVCYTYRGNWKMQMENAMDQYHLTSVHSSFMDVMAKRSQGAGNTEARQFDWKKRLSQQAGMFDFEYGHSAIWIDQAEVEKRPVFATIDEVRSRVGEAHAEWMLKGRNALVFPNMQIADVTTLNVRTFRPISVDLTEMRVHCLAPIGEDPATRQWRLRQFEDFFGASGLASPDDSACFESLQRGYAAEPFNYLQGYFRGLANLQSGANANADRLGIRPANSQQGNFDLNCETSLHAPMREWVRLMSSGVAAEIGAREQVA